MPGNLRNQIQHLFLVATDPASWVGAVGLAAIVAVIYFSAAQLSLLLLTKPEGVAVFWPAAGVAAGALIALGPRARVSVAAAAAAATIAANLLGDRNIWSTICFALCNAGEALLVAWLIELYFGPTFSLGRLRNVLGLVIAAFIGTAVSGIGGALAFKLFHNSTTPLLTTWQHWVESDALGIITVAPLVIELASSARERPSPRELVEGVLAIAALALMTALAILLPPRLIATVVPVALLFPPLLWLAARCRPIFATAAVFIVSLLIVSMTTFGIGYFGSPELPISERVLAAQTSILLVTLATLVLAALFAEIRDKSHELEIASQHKSQFLANMSHELRTPLNAIIGYSEILQEEISELGADRLVPDLKKIERAGRHLLSLINDILDLSKIEAGRMDVFLEDVQIAPLLDEIRSIIAPLAEQNGNALDFELSHEVGVFRTDRTKLKQCLLNVISNANKFTQNGRVTVAIERISAERPMVRFTVTDTGIGMSEAQLGQLFQAFRQADPSTTKKFGGTGLGLAITQHFCRLLGGDIKVTSRQGQGSNFTITLPDSPSAAIQFEPNGVGAAGDAANAVTVLVVDDDPAAHELLSAMLRHERYRLVHAYNAEEALALARKARPDAITLDILMPKTDGWAVLSALKADERLRGIPVVIVTVVPDRGLGVSLGAADVLTKPVRRAELTALLRRLMRRSGPVLVVEDDAGTRELVRLTVERMGLTAIETENGRSALQWLANNPAPAIVLLDLLMPEIDGFEFLDAFKSNSNWRDIPVLVMTGMQLTADQRDRLLRQVRKVIAKGGSMSVDIRAAITETVRHRPTRTEESVSA